MNVETFFERFELFADAPSAVAKMRELVLAFAVQGRLIEQSVDDGDAAGVFAAISHATGEPIDWESYEPEEPPLTSLPTNWRWARTAWLCDLQTGKRMKGGARDSGVISLGGEHLRPGGTVDYSIPRFVSESFFEEMRNGRVCVHDTLMVKDGATTGKAAFVSALPHDGRAAVNEHVFILRWHEPIEKQFAFYFIRAFAMSDIATKSAGVIGGIRRDAVNDFPFPLPPLAEQKRIVAKVDALMVLCDELAQQQQEREQKHAALARASLARFGSEPIPANLEYLLHKSYDIDPADLRKSILTMAVQGRLVPQDDSDETAQKLCQRIATEKLRQVQAGVIKKEKELQELSDSELLFPIPASWRWIRAGNLCLPISSGSTPDKKYFHDNEGIPYLKVYNIRNQLVDFDYRRQFIDSEQHRVRMKRSRLLPGEVILNIVGPPLGKVAIVPNIFPEWNCNQAIAFFRPILPELSPYIYTFLKEGSFLDRIHLIGTAGQDNISVTKCKQIPIPLPPLAEQRRIVAKIDRLMALVDELEAQLTRSREHAADLLEAVIAELTSSTEGAPKSQSARGQGR